MTATSARTSARPGALVDLGCIVVALLALSGAGLLVFVLGKIPKGGLVLAALTAAQMGALIAVATGLMRRRGDSWRSLGLARPASWRRAVGLAVGGYVAVIVVNAVILTLLVRVFALEPPDIRALGELKGQLALYLFWLGTVWLSAAFGEEMLFRGFMWSRLERLIGGGSPAPIAALFIQAILFGAGHFYQGLTGILVTTVIGLVVGAIYLAGRRNLAACILLHGLIDSISLTVLFLGPPRGL